MPSTTPQFIYWFAYYNIDSPSVRYRGQYPLEYLQKNYGVNYYFVTPRYRLSNILKFIIAYLSALIFRKPNSLIVIQKVNSNFIYSALLKFLIRVRKSGTIYDLDDADYLEHPPETIYYFIRHCSIVCVGSKELQKNLSGLNKNVILNTSPTPDLNIIKKKRNQIFNIGWIGDFAGGHKESLVNNVFPVLNYLPFNVKLTLIGVKREKEIQYLSEYFKALKNVELDMPQDINWHDEKDIQQRISEFDLGIATLVDTELHRSKSAFKLKQYMNNGIPVLSSALPENSNFIEDEQNGFLCSTPDEFKNRIVQIEEMNDEDYFKLSKSAHASNVKFNLSTYAETLLSIPATQFETHLATEKLLSSAEGP